jgi:hypothetical protein
MFAWTDDHFFSISECRDLDETFALKQDGGAACDGAPG